MTGKAIVTASDSGIGKASAVELARAGCDVGVTWHEDEQGAQGAAERSEISAGPRRCGDSISRMRPGRPG